MALAAAAVLGGLAATPPAHARSHVRHLPFRSIPTANVLVDGAHVLLGGRILLDERTNAQTSIAPPAGCAPAAIGGPWIAASCGLSSGNPPAFAPQPALYSISTGAWTALTPDPSIVAACAIDAAEACQIRAVGRHWLAIYEQDFGGSRTVFQNLTSGWVSPDPTTATMLPDLDSPRLASTVCSPLRVPSANVEPRGSLTFAGRFGLAVRPTSALSSTTYVQRCGSRSRTFVCRCSPGGSGNFHSVAANAHVVIWAAPPAATLGTPVTHLDGMYLPSRHRFVIPLPLAARGRGTEWLQLSSRSLYVLNNADTAHTFRAPSPR